MDQNILKKFPTKRRHFHPTSLYQAYCENMSIFILPNLTKESIDTRRNVCSEIWDYFISLPYLIQYAKKEWGIDTSEWEIEYKKYQDEFDEKVKRIGKKYYWKRTRDELENEVEKFEVDMFPTYIEFYQQGILDDFIEIGEMDDLMSNRDMVEFAFRFFPTEYGNFDKYKTVIAKWDASLIEHLATLRNIPNFINIGTFYLPLDYWWDHVWHPKDAE